MRNDVQQIVTVSLIHTWIDSRRTYSQAKGIVFQSLQGVSSWTRACLLQSRAHIGDLVLVATAAPYDAPREMHLSCTVLNKHI